MLGGMDRLLGNRWKPGQLYDFPKRNLKMSTNCSTCKNCSNEKSNYGTSVIGLKYDEGVMVAADHLQTNMPLSDSGYERVWSFNSKTIVGFGGVAADYQSLKMELEQRDNTKCWEPTEFMFNPRSIYTCCTEICYIQRRRWKPLMIDVVVAGWQNDEPFLGHVDKRGCAYEDGAIATGHGKRVALPFLRRYGTHLDHDAAMQVVCKTMETLYYSDSLASKFFTLAVQREDENVLTHSIQIAENWLLATQ